MNYPLTLLIIYNNTVVSLPAKQIEWPEVFVARRTRTKHELIIFVNDHQYVILILLLLQLFGVFLRPGMRSTSCIHRLSLSDVPVWSCWMYLVHLTHQIGLFPPLRLEVSVNKVRNLILGFQALHWLLLSYVCFSIRPFIKGTHVFWACNVFCEIFLNTFLLCLPLRKLPFSE